MLYRYYIRLANGLWIMTHKNLYETWPSEKKTSPFDVNLLTELNKLFMH